VISKTDLRRTLRGLRRQLAAEGAGRAAAERLPLDSFSGFAEVAGYIPQGSEIDARPLMRRLAEAGAKLMLPVVIAPGAPLEFRRWQADAPLAPDALGVPSPYGAPADPALIIVPLLAFDRAGGRLGQGGGYYDRALAALRRVSPVFALGLAYAGQEISEVPSEPHDQRLDAILTETEFIRVARERG
jgi:5-formyltetrahydrofolate cyclo-ligase